MGRWVQRVQPTQKYIVWSKCTAVVTALPVWMALITYETMAMDLSRGKKLQEQRLLPAVERPEQGRSAFCTAVVSQIKAAPTSDLSILGPSIPPGTAQQSRWVASQNYAGMGLRAPIFVANGRQLGKVLCLTATDPR